MPEYHEEAELSRLIDDAIAEEPWKGAGYSLARTFSRNLVPLYGIFLFFSFCFFDYLFLSFFALLTALLLQIVYVAPKLHLLDRVESPPETDNSTPHYKRILNRKNITLYLIAAVALAVTSIIATYAPQLNELCLGIKILIATAILSRCTAAIVQGAIPYDSVKKGMVFFKEENKNALRNYALNNSDSIALLLSEFAFRKTAGARILHYHLIVVFSNFVLSAFIFLQGEVSGKLIFYPLLKIVSCLFLLMAPVAVILSLKNYQLDCVALRVMEKQSLYEK